MKKNLEVESETLNYLRQHRLSYTFWCLLDNWLVINLMTVRLIQATVVSDFQLYYVSCMFVILSLFCNFLFGMLPFVSIIAS